MSWFLDNGLSFGEMLGAAPLVRRNHHRLLNPSLWFRTDKGTVVFGRVQVPVPSDTALVQTVYSNRNRSPFGTVEWDHWDSSVRT